MVLPFHQTEKAGQESQADIAVVVKKLQQDVDILKRQVKSLRQTQQQQDEWLDTVNSPIYKRIWWFIKGYRFYRLGRWYDKNRRWGE